MEAYVPPKRPKNLQFQFTVSQEIILFMTTAVRISNTPWLIFIDGLILQNNFVVISQVHKFILI
jgi:hypothetical protein